MTVSKESVHLLRNRIYRGGLDDSKSTTLTMVFDRIALTDVTTEAIVIDDDGHVNETGVFDRIVSCFGCIACGITRAK